MIPHVSSSALAAALPALPAHQRMGPAEDFALIPPLKGVEEWAFPAFPAISGGSGGGAKFSTGQSALLGDFRPPQAAVQPVASTTRCGVQQGVGKDKLGEGIWKATDPLFLSVYMIVSRMRYICGALRGPTLLVGKPLGKLAPHGELRLILLYPPSSDPPLLPGLPVLHSLRRSSSASLSRCLRNTCLRLTRQRHSHASVSLTPQPSCPSWLRSA